MDMTGEQRIPASREAVWKALNDPEILRVCIPGCQRLEKTSDTDLSAIAVIKVGPISARFEGVVTLSDLDPPNSYRISGEGQGGVAGFAKGEARVRLVEDAGETILHYAVSAQVGGKLAQLGARLIDATAKHMSAAFFSRFAEEVTGLQASPAGKSVPARPATTTPRGLSAFQLALLALAIAGAAAALYFFGGAGGALGHRGGASTGDLSAAIILILVGAVGYLLGRLSRMGTPVIVIDQSMLEKLSALSSERRDQ
ncbi:MAG: carbon monoxide dehydrogenase subunit G [Hyphomonadaceae bacterium]